MRKKTAKPTEKHTLITNIREVGYMGIRMWCNAVVISEYSAGILGPNWTIRGFGTEASWDNFQFHLRKESFPYTLKPFESKMAQLLKENGELESLFIGNILSFQNGLEFSLYSRDSKRPVDVTVFEGDRSICDVWEDLLKKAVEYWDAPNMPHLKYESIEAVRGLLSVHPNIFTNLY